MYVCMYVWVLSYLGVKSYDDLDPLLQFHLDRKVRCHNCVSRAHAMIRLIQFLACHFRERYLFSFLFGFPIEREEEEEEEGARVIMNK